MVNKKTSPRKLIVLVGAGYANVEVLRQHLKSPFPGCEVLLISPRPTKFLRSMLPWVISGEARRSHAEIDLLKLCRAAGAELLIGEVEQVDVANKTLVLKNGGQVYFDFLSISVGSGLKSHVQGPQVILGNHLESLLDSFDRLFGSIETPRIAIYGDSALARLLIRGISRLKASVDLTLIAGSPQYLQGIASLERLRLNHLIKKLKAKVMSDTEVTGCTGGHILLGNSDKIGTDLLILADEGDLSPLFLKSGFQMRHSQVLVNDALQLPNCRAIFVAGPGVAVQGNVVGFNPNRPSYRFGKIIAENLRREIKSKPLVVFRSEYALASWIPNPPEKLSLRWAKLRGARWNKWLSRKKIPSSGSYVCASSGEVLRSNSSNTSLTLISSQARMQNVEPHWVAQMMGRQVLHQSKIKKVGLPKTLQAHLRLRTAHSSKKMIKTKISQVKAGLELLNPPSIEVRVSASYEESIHLSSELTFQPNLLIAPGHLIYLVGKLGSVQSLHFTLDEQVHGESWYDLRNSFSQDLGAYIDLALSLGVVDGCVLDERGFVRNLEDLIVPNNLGVSIDLDRVPVHAFNQRLAIDVDSSHVRQNLEFAKYLPEDKEALLNHPRFLALFGAEVSGMLLVLPKDSAPQIAKELNQKFPQVLLTPLGATIEGPVKFRFRLTTK